MLIKKGIPVSSGVAICPAFVLESDEVEVLRRSVPAADLPMQHQRLTEALQKACAELETLQQTVQQQLGADLAAIFAFHLGILRDRTLVQQIGQLIDSEKVTAEYALSQVMREYAQKLLVQPSEFFRERVADVRDLEKRVLKHLLQATRAELGQINHDIIAVAHDLTPSQTASLNKSRVRAFVADVGGRTSHSSIVARAMGIPAVVGLEDISTSVNSGDMLIVDGNRGLVIINPTAEQLTEYQGYSEQIQAYQLRLKGLAELPAVTIDGVRVHLYANIEFNEEIPAAIANGAEGIGLYRTEYLFLSTESEPDEETQYQTLRQAIEMVGDRPIVIRTFDLGADKYTQKHAENPERNPFLGCRSIRYCLQNLKLFKTHLRAILRASVSGKVRVMFPLITNTLELRQARMILNDVIEDLQDEGTPHNPNVPIGMMIEVPSAALMASAFTREVNFFSIGTNDLTQYTLAVDRGNENVANLYSPAHPAVVNLIKDVIRAGKRGRIETSCCGEMAGEVEYTMLLVGMGLRRLSMAPGSIPEVKQVIRSVSIKDCERVARRVASYDTERQVINYLREETRKVIPEVFDGRTV